jgi:CheY-like chemotaxis protein
LVVEDDDDARALVTTVLERYGAAVTTARDVKEALASIETDPPDVLLSDIGLPGESGYELIRRVRALRSERGGRIPAAAITAFARAEDRCKALSAGYLVHVAKPLDPMELVTIVAALSRHAPRKG